MKIEKTIKNVMSKHKLKPKEFAEISGMEHQTCIKINQGRQTRFDQFACFIDYAIQRGMSYDTLTQMKGE